MTDETPRLPTYLPDQTRVKRLEEGKPKDPVPVDKPGTLKIRMLKVKAHRRKAPARPEQYDRRNPKFY